MRWCERRVIETELRQRVRTKVLHHHVGAIDETIDERAPVRMLEIERDAFLVPVDAQEIGAFAVEKRRPPGACVVAFPRLFHLDDARPHVGQQHCAVRARQHAGEVEHGDSVEGRHNTGMIIVYAGSA